MNGMTHAMGICIECLYLRTEENHVFIHVVIPNRFQPLPELDNKIEIYFHFIVDSSEFSVNVFTEFAKFIDKKYLLLKGFEPVVSSVKTRMLPQSGKTQQRQNF